MTKDYYQQNHERILAHAKAYYEQNRDKLLAQNKAYKAAHQLYGVWTAMMRRCGHFQGGSTRELANYAGRGITVCEEWRHFKPFEAWCLANGWKKGLQIDRIDNNGNYCPENCRFVTPHENMSNRRNTILAAGIPLATWYDAYKAKMNELGLSYKQVLERFTKLGWSLEASLFIPPQKTARNKI